MTDKNLRLNSVEFLLANGLNEIISESEVCNVNASKNSFFIEKQSSQITLSSALSTLAKRPNNTTTLAMMPPKVSEIIKRAEEIARECKDLDSLYKAVKDFDGCSLKKMATNTVFSDGIAESKIMFIGEAPGNNEDLEGRPFCGDSGKVLDKMLSFIGLDRTKNFYITNVIFWRPPGNRKPTEDELAICAPFVKKHISLIQPKIIVLVGSTAMNSIMQNNATIGSIRGKFSDFKPDYLPQGARLMTIFHPSYLLRQPAKKKLAWIDMLTIEKELANLS